MQESYDLAGEQIDVDRFLDVAIASCCQGSLPIAAHHVCGDGNYRDMGEFLIGFKLFGHAQTIDLGHVDIDQDEIWLMSVCELKPFRRTAGPQEGVSFSLQHPLHQDTIIEIVLDVKDFQLLLGHYLYPLKLPPEHHRHYSERRIDLPAEPSEDPRALWRRSKVLNRG